MAVIAIKDWTIGKRRRERANESKTKKKLTGKENGPVGEG